MDKSEFSKSEQSILKRLRERPRSFIRVEWNRCQIIDPDRQKGERRRVSRIAVLSLIERGILERDDGDKYRLKR